MAQYSAKRVKGAKTLEDHDYGVIIIDPISAILHNPKAVRNSMPPQRSLLLMIDTIIALTGSAVITAMNPEEYSELANHADSIISLSPVDGCPNMYNFKGSFREFPTLPSRDCSWRYPRFIV
jgi:hypothetical protein